MLRILRYGLLLGFFFAVQSYAAAFVVLADIHFDPYQTCAKNYPCPLIEALRKAPATQWASILAKFDTNTPRFYKDTNDVLLQSSLTEAKSVAAEQHAQFALLMGDELGHQYRELFQRYTIKTNQADYQAFVDKTFQFLALRLNEAFPTINVYSALGNNDSYYGDYYVAQSKSHFLSQTGATWSSLIKDPHTRLAMANQFSVGGYYALTLPNTPAVRLIVLNTNVFSYKAKGKNISQNATRELTWLRQQLQDASNQHQKVFLMMHIPLNIDIYASLRLRLLRISSLWQASAAANFEQLLKEYSGIISGIFTGHLHADWLHIQTLPNKDQIPILGMPAISPIFGSVPSIKVVFYSDTNDQIQNYLLYSNRLNEAGWKLEYDFNRTYHRHCVDCSLIELGSGGRSHLLPENFAKISPLAYLGKKKLS